MFEFPLKRVRKAKCPVSWPRQEAELAREAEELLRFEADACTPAEDPDWTAGFDG